MHGSIGDSCLNCTSKYEPVQPRAILHRVPTLMRLVGDPMRNACVESRYITIYIAVETCWILICRHLQCLSNLACIGRQDTSTSLPRSLRLSPSPCPTSEAPPWATTAMAVMKTCHAVCLPACRVRGLLWAFSQGAHLACHSAGVRDAPLYPSTKNLGGMAKVRYWERALPSSTRLEAAKRPNAAAHQQ
jgi:hypothetical protein